MPVFRRGIVGLIASCCRGSRLDVGKRNRRKAVSLRRTPEEMRDVRRENFRLCASRAVVAVLLLLFSDQGTVAAGPEGGLAERLEAIVRVHTEIPRRCANLRVSRHRRDGSGVVIDDAGLVVTIGYLITEAMGAEVTTGAGRVSRADVVGFDIASGLGLLRAAEPLAVKPLPIGAATELSEKRRS